MPIELINVHIKREGLFHLLTVTFMEKTVTHKWLITLHAMSNLTFCIDIQSQKHEIN